MRHVLIAASAVAALSGAAYAIDLAVWTFETSVPITAGPHAAEGGVNGGGSLGLHVSGAAVYSNPVGNGSGESFSSNNWGIGDYYQFSTSTAGYENITFGWDQTRSSTGPGTFDVEWSTDGSTFFTLFDDYAVGTTTWSSGTHQPASVFAPLSAPAALDNQGTVFFRLTNQVTPGGTAGTNRVDNIIIGGDLIPTPGAAALFGVAGLVATRRRRG